MKSIKLAFIAAGIVMSVSAYSQTDSTVVDSSATTTPATPSMEQPIDSAGNAGSSKPLVTPNFGTHYIAVLGNYTSSPATSKSEKNVTITGDEENPGKIWIEGLTDVKIYALRKGAPGTYKVPAQKAAEKSISEGTVIYDDSNKQINICLGCKYKDENPSDAFTSSNSSDEKPASSKKKMNTTAKIIQFTGNKTDAGTAAK